MILKSLLSKCQRTGCNHTVGSALGHNYSDVVTAPNCTTNGYTTHTCTRCRHTYIDAEIAKLGHDMSDATCTEASKCKRSGCTYTVGTALGHTWSNAICTTPKTCSACGKAEGIALGHSWNDGVVTKEPTTENTGIKTYTCITCGEQKTENIPVLTHVTGDVDGNEEITSSDAVYLLMYTFFPEDYPVSQESDFNGDGEVNSSDAVYLLMYTFFPEDYPLVHESTPALVSYRKREDK